MPACPSCGVDNQEDDRFCLACGNPLGPPQQTDDLINAGVVCPKCDAYNDPGLTECISCGQDLTGMTGYLSAVAGPDPEDEPPDDDATMVVDSPRGATSELPVDQPDPSGTKPDMQAVSAPTEPQPSGASPARPPTAQLPGSRPTTGPGQPAAGGMCPHCRAALPAGAGVCLACGQKVTAGVPVDGVAADLSIRLRLVRGYGREDSTFPVGPGGVTVGRSGALINIADDPFLSPVHLGLRLDGGRLVAEDRGSFNGTFLRVRGQVEIKQGAEFVSGNQRFLLLGLGGPTRDVRMPASQDTRAYGGPVPKQLFVAVRLNHADANAKPLAGSVILRAGPVITVGQKNCDLNFPTDPAMSPHQFELHLKPSGTQLVEAGSSTGVFLRITARTGLQNGDELMVGDEVFRVEIG